MRLIKFIFHTLQICQMNDYFFVQSYKITQNCDYVVDNHSCE
nr:MAG TPA: hypothetical protein [Caudoviricetes sp.]